MIMTSTYNLPQYYLQFASLSDTLDALFKACKGDGAFMLALSYGAENWHLCQRWKKQEYEWGGVGEGGTTKPSGKIHRANFRCANCKELWESHVLIHNDANELIGMRCVFAPTFYSYPIIRFDPAWKKAHPGET
jgi:hypothetical protein